MRFTIETTALRVGLEQACKANTDGAVWENIQRLEQHSIKRDLSHGGRFVCWEHALRLYSEQEYQDWKSEYGKRITSADFGKHVLRFLAETDRWKTGDLLIYFYGDTPTHVGILSEYPTVNSKWGNGLLLTHELTEVPANYGNEARTYSPIDAISKPKIWREYDAAP